MALPLRELKALACKHRAPIIYAGDIWDHYRMPPEVINFAIKELPKGYAIPGQHDLPHHNYADIKKSAYWTLVEAGVLVDLPPGYQHYIQNGLVVVGFPWGYEIKPLTKKVDKTQPESCIYAAIVHAYIWTSGNQYPGAPQAQAVSGYFARLAGFDAAFFGDNHRGFLAGKIMNCGSLMRRKSDEINYKPGVGLLHANGHISRYNLDTSQDKIYRVAGTEEILARTVGMETFMNELMAAGDAQLDFPAAIHRYCAENNVVPRVRALLLEAIDTHD